MPTVKTAISLQRSLFEKVSDLAEKLKISRSQLFVLAMEDFIKHFKARTTIETLNEVYKDEPDPKENAIPDGIRRHHKRLVEEKW